LEAALGDSFRYRGSHGARDDSCQGLELPRRHQLRLIQGEIHLQHIDARLQESQLPPLRALPNDLPHLIFAQSAFAGEARHLKLRCCRGDIGIQSGS